MPRSLKLFSVGLTLTAIVFWVSGYAVLRMTCEYPYNWSKLAFGNQPTKVIDAGEFEDIVAVVFYPLAIMESRITGVRIVFHSPGFRCGTTASF